MTDSRPGIQQAMRAELTRRTLFDRAHALGMSHLQAADDREVFPHDAALAALDRFDEAMPHTPGDAQQILELLGSHGAPATVMNAGGRYFGFVTGGTVPVGLAAKLLASYWDQNAALEAMSPLVARLESVVEGWLRELFALPPQTAAGFVSGTSLATFCGLAAARFRLLERADWDVNEQGLWGAPPLRVVTSGDAHATVTKAIAMLGFGKGNVEWIDVDDQGRLLASALPVLDDRTLVVLQAGSVNSGSFDPFAEVCTRAREAGAWVHIDGAFGLWAALAEPLAPLTAGIELADSWAVDGHKTLNTPYDCGVVLCRDREALSSALHASGSYLVPGAGRDGMYFTPEMSRRARVIELWATLKYLGRQGIGEMVLGMHERARQFASALEAVAGLEVVNEVAFNQVMVRCASDVLTDQLCARVQALRECWVGGSVWQGRRVIRISVCSWATTAEDVERSVASFVQALADVDAAAGTP